MAQQLRKAQISEEIFFHFFFCFTMPLEGKRKKQMKFLGQKGAISLGLWKEQNFEFFGKIDIIRISKFRGFLWEIHEISR